jgi:hypothetical protein
VQNEHERHLSSHAPGCVCCRKRPVNTGQTLELQGNAFGNVIVLLAWGQEFCNSEKGLRSMTGVAEETSQNNRCKCSVKGVWGRGGG